MEFRALGPLVVGASASSQIGGPRERKILAALVLMANQPVSTRHLIDVVWHESPPTTARQQVQNCVGSLRTKLRGRAQIIRKASTYSLSLAEEQVDVLVFQRMCGEADRRLAVGDRAGASEILRSALGLWRGDVLEDVESEALAGRIATLEEARVRAIERYVGLQFAMGRQAEVIADLAGWVRRYPYHEALHCFLAEALGRTGRSGEALRALQEFQARLRAELGIAAGDQVREVERRLSPQLHASPRARSGERDVDLAKVIHVAAQNLSEALQILAARFPAA